MSKRGQVFLIAAVVIVGIIVTLAAVNISTRTSKEESVIYDLKDEIDFESSQLIDSGVYQPDSGDIEEKINSLISNYSALNPDTNFTSIYGDAESITVTDYAARNTGNACVSGGGTCSGQQTSQIESTKTTFYDADGDNKITIEFRGGNKKELTLKPGENFFMILKKTQGEETYVAGE